MLAAEVTADKGEKEIGSDAESMYAFSAFAAASAATKWFVKEYLKNAYKTYHIFKMAK